MKSKLLIASLFAIITGSVNAQWYKQQIAGSPSDFYSISCADNNTCFAVGKGFTKFKTLDGGATFWTIAGGTAGTESRTCVKMYDQNLVVIGQRNGNFRKTVNGSGACSWTGPYYGGNISDGIYGMILNSATNFVAVGGDPTDPNTGGHITTTSNDGGATWAAVNVSGEPAFFGVCALNSTTYYACGGTASIYKTTNSGATWTAQRTGSTLIGLYDITFPDPTNNPSVGYAVGGSLDTATGNANTRVFKTTDGGANWTNSVNGLPANTLYGCYFFDKDTGIVVGYGGIIYITTDGATTWTQQVSPVTTNLYKIYFPTKQIGYIVGANGVILKTTNRGFIPALTVNAGGNKSVCPGFCATLGGANLASGGTPPYTYSWSPGGNTTNSIVVCPTSQVSYTVTVTDVNSVSKTDSATVSIHTVAPVSFSGLPAVTCGNATTIALTGSPAGGTFSGTGVSGTSFNPVTAGSGNHTVGYMYTDTNGCVDTAMSQMITVTSAPAAFTLCMATVDSVNSSTNILTWSKPVSNNIVSFRIYKNVAGTMTKIGTDIPYAAPSIYTDAAVNPKTSFSEYAITVVDTCGIESSNTATPQAPHHTTMFLSPPGFTPPKSFSLQWTDYLGYPISQYYIWRDDSSLGHWHKIDSVLWTSPNKYIDNQPIPMLNARYKIYAVVPGSGCVISDSIATDTIRVSMSNISDNVAGISEVSLNNLLNVYPNPNNGTFTIQMDNGKWSMVNGSTSAIKIYSMHGKLVYESALKDSRSEISVPGIAPGIYQLQVITDKGIANKKITIQ